MRIISGKYKGKKIDGFMTEGTRPTMDRVKESFVAMISPYLKDKVCLDLFAGSGSVGLEFLSNGAKICYFVEKSTEAYKVLQKNCLNIENCYLVNSDYAVFLKNTKQKFDIVFLDPPYERKLINKALELLLKNDLLNDKALVICEFENEKIITSLKVFKEKKYGNKNIVILIKE
jgi:16S rRNA (guanine966-N2)-methyltransferase